MGVSCPCGESSVGNVHHTPPCKTSPVDYLLEYSPPSMSQKIIYIKNVRLQKFMNAFNQIMIITISHFSNHYHRHYQSQLFLDNDFNYFLRSIT